MERESRPACPDGADHRVTRVRQAGTTTGFWTCLKCLKRIGDRVHVPPADWEPFSIGPDDVGDAKKL